MLSLKKQADLLREDVTDSQDEKRAAVMCEECGSVYAGRVTSDGRIYPIGAGKVCACGCEEFQLIE